MLPAMPYSRPLDDALQITFAGAISWLGTEATRFARCWGAWPQPTLSSLPNGSAAVSGRSVWHGKVLIRTTVSVGVAVGGGEDERTLEELIDDADANLYRAKRDGRDRITASTPSEGGEASVRTALH